MNLFKTCINSSVIFSLYPATKKFNNFMGESIAASASESFYAQVMSCTDRTPGTSLTVQSVSAS